MNEYKIKLTETYKKQAIVEAENPEMALDIIQNKYMKANKKDFKNKNLYEIEAKVIEENGKILDDNPDENINNENELKLKEIDKRLDRMENIILRIINAQNYIDDKMDFIEDFAEQSVELLDEINESLDVNLDNLMDNVEKNIEE